jgi:putative ABC transport system permease protein
MVSRTLSRKLARDARRSWPVFAALVATVALGVGLFAASYNAYRDLAGSYDHAFAVQRFPDLFISGGDTNEIASAAVALDGVTAVRTRTVVDLPMRVTDSDGVSDAAVGRIVSFPETGEPTIAALTRLQGAANPTSGGDVLIEQHLAESFGLHVGDALTVMAASGPVPTRVSGIVASAEYLWPAPSRQQVMAPPRSFGVLFASPQDVAAWSRGPDNQVLVVVADEAADTLQAVRRAAYDNRATEVLTRAEQPSNSLLHEDILGFQQMAVSFPALFLSAAGLVLFVLLSRRVAVERPVIGTLRAFGAGRGAIGRHYLGYGLAAGALGSVIGLVIGLVAAGQVSRAYARTVDLPESLLVFGGIRPGTVALGLAFSLGATSLAALVPAYRATRVAPAEAMRPNHAAVRARTSAPERLLRIAPSARTRYILRSIGRNRSRSAFTATGVALAFILVLASWGLLDTMSSLLARQFSVIDTSDAAVAFQEPVTSAVVADLETVPGVAAAEAVTQLPVGVQAHGSSYQTTVTGFSSDTAMHAFRDSHGHALSLKAGGVLLGQSITATLTGLQVGDQITLVPRGAGHPATARVDGFLAEPLGTFAYADQAWLASALGEPPNTALLRTAPGADPTAVRRAVQAVPGVTTYVETSAIERLAHQYAGLFLAFGAAMLLLGATMAFAVIFTTMSVSLLDRRRELATFRAAGVSRRSLAGLVTGENMLVATLGIIPGLVLGLLAADAMVRSYSSDQFSLELTIRPTSIALAIAAILAVVALCQVPGVRSIRRLNVAEVVRERE